ncbi:ABC transporter ATP-binding protein [Clostridium rectalis]|uniref:ABC transporter ATP-binding protein n=1 Tax=Clostridium rectalis TaxID=2040295 RepID=UPI000F63357D|nr:ABC transporter ATP-binding protein [Clostridium rectalis]
MDFQDKSVWSLSRVNIKFFIVTLILSIAQPLTFIIFALSLKNLIDSGLQSNMNDLLKSGVYSLMILVLMSLLTYSYNMMKEKYANLSIDQLCSSIFSTVIRKDFPEFQRDKSARYLNLFTEEINTIRNSYIISYFDIIKNASLLIFALIAMLISNWRISIIIIVLCSITILISTFSSSKIEKLQIKADVEEKNYVAKTTNILNGFLVIKSFHVETQIEKEYISSFKDKLDIFEKKQKMMARVLAISNLASYSVILVAFVLGLSLVIMGNSTIGDIVAVTQLVNFVVVPINELSILINEYSAGRATIKKALSLLQNRNKNELGEEFSFSNKIVFKNVSFNYPNSTIDKKAISNIDLKFEKGKKYAIIGMSGSGKSTIMNLILRFFDIPKNSGEILIDDKPINNLSLESLYKNIAIIQQSVYIFDDTLKNNITLNKNYSDMEIQKSIELSGLKDLVSSHKDGIELACGENGSLLSGGERQRLSIARSLICKTPILLLDEAMSALDRRTSFEIETALLNIKNLTTIVITHSLIEEVLKQYDEIIMMNKGEIIEKGTFLDLMKKKGDFYNLYQVEKLSV